MSRCPGHRRDPRCGSPETNLYLCDIWSLCVTPSSARFTSDRWITRRGVAHARVLRDGPPRMRLLLVQTVGLRRLVAGRHYCDHRAAEEVTQRHYYNQPVSLYGGMVNLPLVVTRPDGLNFFDPTAAASRPTPLCGPVRRGGSELRSPRSSAHCATASLASAWNCVRPRRAIVHRNGGKSTATIGPIRPSTGAVVGSFRALEVHVGGTLESSSVRENAMMRHMNVDGSTVDLANARGLSLSRSFMCCPPTRDDGRRWSILSTTWTVAHTDLFIGGARSVPQVRNDATHGRRIDQRTASSWRNQFLGVGSTDPGHLVQLAEGQLR